MYRKLLLIKIKRVKTRIYAAFFFLAQSIFFNLLKAHRKPLWLQMPCPHHRISFSLLILVEHKSQDTYSLSYGNIIPDTIQCAQADFLASYIT